MLVAFLRPLWSKYAPMNGQNGVNEMKKSMNGFGQNRCSMSVKVKLCSLDRRRIEFSL